MPFAPAEHYRNCQDAVSHMTFISNQDKDFVVGRSANWDALRKALTAIGAGAGQAYAEIRETGREGQYNDAYLSMLRVAANLLGLECLALAHDRIADADDGFEMCRDYANAIRDPFNLARFPELRSVPRHDALQLSSRPLLNRLGAVFGHALSAAELAPSAPRGARAAAPSSV